jgi:hypothetical protein
VEIVVTNLALLIQPVFTVVNPSKLIQMAKDIFTASLKLPHQQPPGFTVTRGYRPTLFNSKKSLVMVTISNYHYRSTAEGKKFLVLELEGSLEITKSLTTGRPYASVKRCTIPCSFDELTAKRMVGTPLEGEIIRVSCDPYRFTNPQTKEAVTLDYKYVYTAKEGHLNRDGISIMLKEVDVL